jgi:DNA helicase-2/ATP-dependent DNA helicase PcrA
VLYRLGLQSQLLIEAFQRSGIPFQTVRQKPLGDYKDVRLILAALWFVDNPASTFHLDQVGSKQQVKAIVSWVNGLTDGITKPVSYLIEQLYEYMAGRAGFDAGDDSEERIQQLARRAIPFENRLTDFLESMVLQRETDLYDPRADRVTLMTLHAAKGLEFPVVFIVGCEEGLLPYQRQDEKPDIEEERRLFYVGMTRAQQRLILTHATNRHLFGQSMNSSPSRFLDDIEQALKEIKQSSTQRKPSQERPDHIQLKLL